MPSNIRVEVRSQHDEQVEALEYDVYLKAGYIAANAERRVLENRNYPTHSVIVALDGDVAVGSVRLVVDPKPRFGLFSLHCFNAFTLWPWAEGLLKDAAPTSRLQVGTMVIRESWRGGETFHVMFQKILEMSLQECIHYAVSTVDEGFFNRLAHRNVPFIPMGDTRFYMGSRTVPALVARDWVTRGSAPEELLALVRKHQPALPERAAAAVSA